ncbi:hypothetical protein AMATHDRAFT_75703 [Amanita thiersii Skay4041]|uniref:Fungal lipase-type domain-containing protein n=1 Tax=Amanita thiersii Skay4041 TaxID=703135 RepID=A0A2A9NRH2_9AGAR|nr:hypothetical protein AMATHDRAFT_75703 [Amanita thiersii Skay4041]
MRISTALLPLLAVSVVGSPVATIEKRAVSQSLFNDLVFYFKYASSAYQLVCPNPNGNTLVAVINNLVSDTQGFIARDDSRQEIVVSLRGSTSSTDFLLDAQIEMSPFVSPGVNPPGGTGVHTGFLAAWNSVASGVISAVRDQLTEHPGYSIVTTGHSLGGSLSSLAGISLKQNFPNVNTRMYTYGQPRMWNPTGAFFINQQFGSKAFRAVHTFDGAPTLIPQSFGYRHHGIEYWQFIDPATPSNVRQCAADGEDPTCSGSIPSGGLNPPHLVYFDIVAGTPFC